MWNVRMYMNTGFNAVNVPDSEETLVAAASSYHDFPVIDCLQRYFLPSITIRAFEDDVIQGDYIKLWDNENPRRFAFYSVNSYAMTSGDVIELNITMDPLLSCGGIDNIDFLDGMVSRRHVNESEEYGASNIFSEDDPYLVPRKIFKVAAGEYFGADSVDRDFLGQGDYVLIITSTYDLISADQIELQPSVNFESTGDATTGYISTTPVLKRDNLVDTNHITRIDTSGVSSSLIQSPLVDGNNYMVFKKLDSSNNQLLQRIAELISFGRTDVITGAYLVPRIYVNVNGSFIRPKTSSQHDITSYVDSIIVGSHPKQLGSVGDDFVPYTVISDYCDVLALLGDMIGFYGDDVKHSLHNAKRLKNGKHFAYTFVCKESGDKVEVNPEDFDGSVWVNVDGRKGGQADYYIGTKSLIENTQVSEDREAYYHASEGDFAIVHGRPWDNANLVTMAAAGSFLTANTMATQQTIEDFKSSLEMAFQTNSPTFGAGALNPANQINQAYQEYAKSYAGDVFGMNALEGTLGFAGYFATGLSGTATTGSMSDVVRNAANGNPFAKTIADRYLTRTAEQTAVINNSIPQTQIISGGGGNGIITGYGLRMYRNAISRDDLLRFDRILNQFGWKVTEPIKKEFLNNRQDYNYIDAKGVSIKCNTVPKSVRNDLANLFNGGVRIWHKKPYSDYTQENKEV